MSDFPHHVVMLLPIDEKMHPLDRAMTVGQCIVDIIEWMKANTNSEYKMEKHGDGFDSVEFSFANLTDATVFKLRWIG